MARTRSSSPIDRAAKPNISGGRRRSERNELRPYPLHPLQNRRQVVAIPRELVQQLLPQPVEIRSGALARVGQLDLHHRLDPPRPRRHHHHTVGQVDGFLGIVGDQQGGNAGAFADGQQLVLQLQEPLAAVPGTLSAYDLKLGADGNELIFTYDTRAGRTGITALLKDVSAAGIAFADLNTMQSSLEEIFVTLVREAA